MSDTTTTTTTPDTSPSNEALNPGEMAYFQSRGEDTSGVVPADAAKSEQQISMFPDAPEQRSPDAEASDDGDGDELVTIGPDGQPRDEKGRFVPLAALHKERERRKTIETEVMSMREKMARAEERLAVFNDIIAASDGETPAQNQSVEQELGPPPNIDEDIFGYVKWQAKKIELQEQRFADLVRSQEQSQQQAQRDQTAQRVQAYYQNDAAQFVQKQPDFPDAYRYVANSYTTELRAQGVPDDKIQMMLLAEEARIAMNAQQSGQSPSQIIYEMAKARGYRQAQPEVNPQNGALNATQKMETIQRGKAATVSLSGAGGSSGEGLTLEALSSMSEDEFRRVTSKLSKSQMRALMGG